MLRYVTLGKVTWGFFEVAEGSHRALCTLCAKVGYFGPLFPDGQGDRSNYCVPMRRTAPDSHSV